MGCGGGLRPPHYPYILSERPAVDFFEVISENYMDTSGNPLHKLDQIRENYPIICHGVSLSIGSVDPINVEYLRSLKKLIERIEPAIVSDHLCWTGSGGWNTHDLLPLPFTKESVDHIVPRVEEVQNYLGRKILLENASTYVSVKNPEMKEWEFLTEIVKRSGCGILLDINNIYVNAHNHSFSAREYIDSISIEDVGQFHLAGHMARGDYLFDTHDGPVIDPVWDLYRHALGRFGRMTTLIEWDGKIPEFPVLQDEIDQARTIQEEICGRPQKVASAF